MGRGANGSPAGSPTVLDVVLDLWTVLIFVPAILISILVLVIITRRWDRRDGMLVTEKKVRDGRRRGWRRQARCTCSWHTIGTEVSAGGG
jgi:hypothetical protein